MRARSRTIARSIANSHAMLPAGPAPADEELAAYCPDLDQWPRSWMYEERDVSPGGQMVECFKPFLRHLLSLGLSRKTLRQHRDNLWLLGGELIRDLHDAPRLRKRPMDQVVLADIDQEAAVRFTSIRHITHIRRTQPTDSPEEAFFCSALSASMFPRRIVPRR